MQRILVIEDEEPIRLLLERRLRNAGFEVQTALNGAAALELAKNNPALILLDLRLPDTTGTELAERFRASEPTTHTPIIALTASCTEQDRTRAIAAGCNVFLAKPVEWRTLLEQIHALLPEREDFR